MAKRFIAIGIALIMAAAFWPGLAADKSSVDKRIEETQNALQQKKKQEKTALNVLTKNQGELNRIQANLNSISAQLQTAEARAASARVQLERVKQDLLRLEEMLDEQRSLLAKRSNKLYRHGPISYLEVILAASSFSDLINRYEMAGYIIRHDQQVIEEYRAMREAVAEKKKEIEARHQELKERTEAIDALKDKAERDRRLAALKVQDTQAQVKKIQSDRVQLERALDQLQELSRKLGEEMRRKGSSQVSLGSGAMMWPVTGRISSEFGYRVHPILKKKKYHSGLDIAVPSGTPVLAADSGVVKIAGWNGGYGWLVAIDHGKNISTFYGHNSRLLVKEGEAVVKGQRIALSGSTGLSTGPHVHFEVRVDGEPQNPRSYLP